MGDEDSGIGTWNQWARAVVQGQEDIKTEQKETNTRLQNLELQFTNLEGRYNERLKQADKRAGVIVSIGGLVLTIITILINVFIK